MASRPPPIRPDGSDVDVAALQARLAWIRLLTHGRANTALAVEALADVVEALVGMAERPGPP